MTALLRLTRRTLLRWVVQGLAAMRAADASSSPQSPLEIDRLADRGPAGVVATYTRRYRVHAAISVLSVPLFSKDNVGGACAMVEEAVCGSSHTTALQFAGGSWPERLKGFNRFGMTQEIVCRQGPVIHESAYLSIITTSAERNLEQARQSFGGHPAVLPIAVAHGAARRSGYAAALDYLTAPSYYTWFDCPRLRGEIRGRTSSSAEAPADQRGDARGDSAFPTFLHAVRSAILAGEDTGQSNFVHNARLYRLRTQLARGPKLTLMTGRMAERNTEHTSEFRVWFDPRDATAMPARMEFRPKSFLRLVFEHDPTMAGRALPSLIPQEQI